MNFFELYFNKLNDYIPIFTKDDIKYLKKYGNFLKKLHAGEIDPETEKQKEFVKYIVNSEEPEHYEQIVWDKFISAIVLISAIEDNIKGKTTYEINRYFKLKKENFKKETSKNIPFQESNHAKDNDNYVERLRSGNNHGYKLEPIGNTCKFCNGDGLEGRCFHCHGTGIS